MNDEHDILLRALATQRREQGLQTATPAASGQGTTASGADCPPPAQLRALRDAQLSPEAQEQLAMHLTSCPHCTDLLVAMNVDVSAATSPERVEAILRQTVLVWSQPQEQVSQSIPSQASPSLWTTLSHWLQELSFGWKAIGMALPVALLLIVFFPASPPSTLPPYIFSVAGDVQAVRSETRPEAGTDDALRSGQLRSGLVFTSSSTLILRASPEGTAKGRLSARLYLGRVSPGKGDSSESSRITLNHVTPLSQVEVFPSTGLIEVRLPLEAALQEQFGRYQAWLLLTSPEDTLPETLDSDNTRWQQYQRILVQFEYRSP